MLKKKHWKTTLGGWLLAASAAVNSGNGTIIGQALQALPAPVKMVINLAGIAGAGLLGQAAADKSDVKEKETIG